MELKDIFTFENLMAAHEACRSGKQHKRGTIAFEMELGSNIGGLAKELAGKTYRPGRYRTFKIYDPKERTIEALAYRDRVVLMCFCKRAMEPRLERRLIHDNAASRKGKGTGFSIGRLHGFMRRLFINAGGNGFYFLKCDISKYFASIDHDILKDRLARAGFSADEMRFMDAVIGSRGAEARGLPLGNQTSQWFALLYLDGLDRFIKEKLRVPYYVRYMDDFILLGADKGFLQKCKAEIQKFAAERLNLELNAKTQVGRIKDGLDFLGYNHRMTATGKIVRKLRASARIRQRRYIKAISRYYLEGALDDEYLDSRQAAFVQHAKGTKDMKIVNNGLNSLRKKKKSMARKNKS